MFPCLVVPRLAVTSARCVAVRSLWSPTWINGSKSNWVCGKARYYAAIMDSKSKLKIGKTKSKCRTSVQFEIRRFGDRDLPSLRSVSLHLELLLTLLFA